MRFKSDPRVQMEIGQRIAQAREAKGLTQQNLADKFGASKQLVSHWESARSELTVPALIQLANELKVQPEWILHGRGKGPATDGNSSAAAAAQVPDIEARVERLEQEVSVLRKELKSAQDA